MSAAIRKIYEAIGLGQFGSNSHPIHTATVHFPLAFLTAANVLNLIYGATLYFPSNPFWSATDQNLGSLSILGFASNVFGMVTAIPALLTGAAELYAMVSSQGLYQKDEKTGEERLIPKVKTTLIHASLNDVVLVSAVYNWLVERNTTDFRPARHQVVMSAGVLAIQFYAAYLGGELVYRHGVGVQRMGKGASEKKEKQN